MKLRKNHFLATITVGISVATVVTTSAATWDGPNNGDYATATNWNPDGVPLSGDTNIASAGGITAIYSTAGNITSTGRILIGSTGANTGTLTMQGSAGTLSFAGSPFNNANYIGVDGSTGTVNVNAGTLALTGMASGAGHLHIGANGSVSNGTLNIGGGTVNVGTRVTMGVAYPGSDAINTVGNSGNGNATLTISSGSLNIGSSTVGDTDKGAIYMKSPTGGTGTATVNLDGGTVTLTRFIPGEGGTSKTLNFNGSTLIARASVVNFLPAATGFTANVKNGGAAIDTQAFNITVGAALVANGNGGLTKSGNGTLTLTGASTYTGATIVSAGTLEFSGAGTTSNAGSINVQNGGTLRFSKNDTWGNDGTGATAAITIDAGGVVQSNNTFNALINLTLNGGTLSANDGVNSNFPTFGLKGTVTVNATAAGSTISTTGVGDFNTVAIGTGTGGGITTFAVANGAAASDLTVSAPLSNLSGAASALTKTGAGTMTLSATNTYTGATAVNVGTLLINGSISTSNLTTVASNATIGGDGTVGALTVSSGGFITPGNSAGELDVAGNYIQVGQYTAEIGGTTPATQYDQIDVAGTVNITGGSLVTMFSGTGYSAGNLIFILLNDLSDTITGTYASYGQGATVTNWDGLDWTISYTANHTGSGAGTFTGGNDIALMAIPEPSAALLGGLGMLVLLRRRR